MAAVPAESTPMILVALLAACTPKTTDDTAAAVVDSVPVQEDTAESQDCKSVYITVQGNDPPVVGDEWDVYLWCDEALLLGSTLLRFDPAELARIKANHATFVEPGEGTILMQVGRHTATRDVTVGEAP